MSLEDRSFTRRELLRNAGFALTGLLFTGSIQPLIAASSGQTHETVTLRPLNRFPRMVQEDFVGRVRKIEVKADRRRAALRTRANALTCVREVRRKIQQCFGSWPEKSPLKAQIIGVIERDAYRIEKVIFESHPNFPVTANLYLPKGRSFPLPAAVGSCGHSENGKAIGACQSFVQGLARQGYVVLIFDPIGQGEQLQYSDAQLKSRIGNGVLEHLYAGNQQTLAGESFAAWHAWDGIRALDYLLTRREVDARHVGLTGNSGGGTVTTWLCGLESRLTMAAPGCFVTTFRRNLENELPQDIEQYPPRALALGLDHADFIAAMAPKPVILPGQEKDYFDARGVEETYQRLRRIYALLGAEENIQLFIGPNYHDYAQVLRSSAQHGNSRAGDSRQTLQALVAKLYFSLNSTSQPRAAAFRQCAPAGH